MSSRDAFAWIVVYFATVIEEALLFPSVQQGLNAAEGSPNSGSVVAGGFRWLAGLVLLPLELCAQFITLFVLFCIVYGLVVLAGALLFFAIPAIYEHLAGAPGV